MICRLCGYNQALKWGLRMQLSADELLTRHSSEALQQTIQSEVVHWWWPLRAWRWVIISFRKITIRINRTTNESNLLKMCATLSVLVHCSHEKKHSQKTPLREKRHSFPDPSCQVSLLLAYSSVKGQNSLRCSCRALQETGTSILRTRTATHKTRTKLTSQH